MLEISRISSGYALYGAVLFPGWYPGVVVEYGGSVTRASPCQYSREEQPVLVERRGGQCGQDCSETDAQKAHRLPW